MYVHPSLRWFTRATTAAAGLLTALGGSEPAQAASADVTAVAVHARSGKHHGLLWPETKSPVLTFVEVRNLSSTSTGAPVKATCTLHRGRTRTVRSSESPVAAPARHWARTKRR